ncbi:MAG: hypothetical protein ACLPXB_05690 [Thiobacillaceae bacterium]
MNAHFFALLLIFGLGHAARDPVDPAKAVQLHSRIPCDGYGGPEEAVHVQVTFSSGAPASSAPTTAAAREFVVSRLETDKCSVETMFQCWHKPRTGWHDVWSAASNAPGAKPTVGDILPLASCHEWGSSEAPQYVLSGWHQEGSESKPMWRQDMVKQVSSQPEVYEFTDPNGGTARLEIRR